MIGTGFAVFIALLFLLMKMPRRLMLRLLHHDAVLDGVVTVIVLIVHWGSFDGVMAATVAGLLTSVATTIAKPLFGHIAGQKYYPGVFHLDLGPSE